MSTEFEKVLLRNGNSEKVKKLINFYKSKDYFNFWLSFNKISENELFFSDKDIKDIMFNDVEIIKSIKNSIFFKNKINEFLSLYKLKKITINIKSKKFQESILETNNDYLIQEVANLLKSGIKKIKVYYFATDENYIYTFKNSLDKFIKLILFKNILKKYDEKIYFHSKKSIISFNVDLSNNLFNFLVSYILSNDDKQIEDIFYIVPSNKKAMEVYFTLKEKGFLNVDVLILILNKLFEDEEIELSYRKLYKYKNRLNRYPTSIKQIEPYKKSLLNLSEHLKNILYIRITDKKIYIKKDKLFENYFSYGTKENPYFYLPRKFVEIDSKNYYLKSILFYLIYLGQIKSVKKDKKLISIISFLDKVFPDLQKILKKKGKLFFKEKLDEAAEFLESENLGKIRIVLKDKFNIIDEGKLSITLSKEYIKSLIDVLKG